MRDQLRNTMGRRLRWSVGLVALWLGTAGVASAEFIIAADNASNAAYGDGWQNGDNGGTGFGPWSLFSNGGTGGFAGFFIGNPANAGINTAGIGTSAFGEYANPTGSGAFANADRTLGAALAIGDVFSFVWGVNFDANNGSGNKGFNLYAGGVNGTQIVNANMGGSSTITVNGNDTGFTYGTNPMTWSFEMITSGSLQVTATPRGAGSNYTATFSVAGAPDAFRFYASGLDGGDARQPYFNNLQVVSAIPEPHSITLAACGAIGLAAAGLRRVRRKRRAA